MYQQGLMLFKSAIRKFVHQQFKKTDNKVDANKIIYKVASRYLHLPIQ